MPYPWIQALADAESLRCAGAVFDTPRPSPHLARWGLTAQEDDGVRVARATIAGARVLVAEQNPGFLGGSIGAKQARVLEHLFVQARSEPVDAVLLLLASGGVRLHEANPAEMALARGLRALFDARVAGVPVMALCVGDVFGGASVLACAAERTGMLPKARLGLSGPKVIATARGPQEIDPDDPAALDAIFGAAARDARHQADLVADDVAAIRAWFMAGIDGHVPFDRALRDTQAHLGAALDLSHPTHGANVPKGWRDALTRVNDTRLWQTRDAQTYVLGAPGDASVSAGALNAIDAALLSQIINAEPRPGALVLVEDSAGHEISRAAEELCLSRYLAQHAAVLGAVRRAGVKVVALLTGRGHSAAFFVNALQADRLIALDDARVMAMDPRAVARVTGLDEAALTASLQTDPVLGHAASLLTHWDAVKIVRSEDVETLDRLLLL